MKLTTTNFNEPIAWNRMAELPSPRSIQQWNAKLCARLSNPKQSIYLGILDDDYKGPLFIKYKPWEGMLENLFASQQLPGYYPGVPYSESQREFRICVSLECLDNNCIPHIKINGEDFILPASIIDSDKTHSLLLGVYCAPKSSALFDELDIDLVPSVQDRKILRIPIPQPLVA